MASSGGFGIGGYGQGGYGASPGPIFSEPVAYYLSLITSEYQGSPKFLAWLTAALKILDDITNCLYSYLWQFDLNVAVGPQMDILGEIIGVSRTVNFQPSGGVSPVLDDKTYRVLLLATIARNQWNGQIDSLQPIWGALFPGGKIILIDNQNMSVTVTLSGAFTSITQDLINHDYIVPRPEGVLMNYEFSTLPMFGFSQSDNAFIAGFGDGIWS